jgi:hypothetical protein
VTSGPYADPGSTVPGQTWDSVTATLTGGHQAAQSLTVTGPDGSGVVTASIDTTGLRVGIYTVTMTGGLLTQNVMFRVRNANSH